LDSCDVFINNFEDLRDELGPLHIVEDEAIETTGRKRQNDFNISDGTDAKKSKREEPNFFPVFFNKISSHRTSFSQVFFFIKDINLKLTLQFCPGKSIEISFLVFGYTKSPRKNRFQFSNGEA